jgi:pyruvate/2-oxoglutarate dehydrogenase complex dihydrolipoamide acyltransferase (E2) component
VQAGEVVPVGTVLVVIGADGTSVPSNSLLQEKEGAGNAPEQSTREPRNRLLQGGQVRATPLVRRLAQELGVDFATVTGDPRRAPHRGSRGRARRWTIA